MSLQNLSLWLYISPSPCFCGFIHEVKLISLYSLQVPLPGWRPNPGKWSITEWLQYLALCFSYNRENGCSCGSTGRIFAQHSSPGSYLQHCLRPGMMDLLMPAFTTMMWRQGDPNFKVIFRRIVKTSLGYMRPCFLKNKTKQRGWGMHHWVNCLPYEHSSLNSISQNPCETQQGSAPKVRWDGTLWKTVGW